LIAPETMQNASDESERLVENEMDRLWHR